MASLPESLGKSSRRQVAQLLRRLLKMAHYPLKLLTTYPLPDTFVPRPPAPRVKTYLHPAEDAELLKCRAVPLVERLYFGFLAREGCRPSEARLLQLRDVEHDAGIIYLDNTKTDRPRDWGLEDGTLEALRLWRDHFMAIPSPTSYIFATSEECCWMSTIGPRSSGSM